MAENENKNNENQSDVSREILYITNIFCGDPRDKSQPLYVFNDAKEWVLPWFFKQVLWWCNEEDRVYQELTRLYHRHLEIKGQKDRTPIRPHYGKQVKKVDENDRYAILNKKAQEILYNGVYGMVEEYVKSDTKDSPQIRELKKYQSAVANAYLSIAKELKIPVTKESIIEKLNNKKNIWLL